MEFWWWKGKDGKVETYVKEFIKKDGARRRVSGGDGRKNKKSKNEMEGDCGDHDEDEEEWKVLEHL